MIIVQEGFKACRQIAVEDVLVLYLTSHGSEDHELSVNFWPLALNDITPEKLRTLLDDAKIKWRVIIVSACYSGGFIKALANDNTLVATAAAADKTSFGCGTKSTFTYFGEAVFKDQLAHEFSLVSAVQQARIAIGLREKRENIEASSPQLSIGPSIKTKLDHLSGEIRLRHCGTDDKKRSR
ncbi:MAG: C13 family peptidase [Methylovulum sp.]|uniref:C13 family peptidase n=1 Tax=Methylovulum sp. TaxID=1916980 RepID=UPI00260965D1|nr:C13 family peptidase [Methylovulum sp.]MDD2725156.1 C13 family peptidase [Methylovulum sp.]MDD5126286.1 C13 family peptidase [Methylovulum sp.]